MFIYKLNLLLFYLYLFFILINQSVHKNCKHFRTDLNIWLEAEMIKSVQLYLFSRIQYIKVIQYTKEP